MTTNVIALHAGKREDPGACEIYRVTTPMYYLGQAVKWSTDWMSFKLWYDYYQLSGNVIKEYTPQQQATMKELWLEKFIDTYDLFVFARCSIGRKKSSYESASILLNKIHRAGKKVIYETDDDLSNEFRYTTNGDVVTFAQWCNAITATTPYLAERMQKKTGKPAYVLPNMLDPLIWKTEPSMYFNDDLIRIGLTGSTTHVHDWKVLETIIPRILDDYPNVKLILGGYNPEYLKKHERVECVPPIPYLSKNGGASYVDMIKNCDIILCPVDPDDPFNEGKSEIKYVEGAGATRLVDGEKMGAACIATNNKIYQLGITNEKHGILVDHTPEAWDSAIRELITNDTYRRDMQMSGYKHIWKDYDLSKGWIQWANVYSKIDANVPVYKKEIVPDYGKLLHTSA